MPLQPDAAPRSPLLHLPACGACGAWSYPPRPRCGHCLADALRWAPCPDGGRVLARVRIEHSHDPAWRPFLPVDVASVQLDAGPVIMAFAPLGLAGGDRCTVGPLVDRGGAVRLVAAPEGCARAELFPWLESQQMELPTP